MTVFRSAIISLLCAVGIALLSTIPESARAIKLSGGTNQISGFTFSTPFQYNLNHYPTHYINSDQWGSTWADNGNIYVVNDDTASGANWDGTGPTSAMEVSTFSTYTTALIGSNINYMASWGVYAQTGTDGLSAKGQGINSVGGNLYILNYRLGTSGSPPSFTVQNGQLIKSTDHGATWSPTPLGTANPYASPMFPGTVFPFGWVQYGQNYTAPVIDNAQTFVYATVPATTDPTHAYLGRVAIANIAAQSAGDWSYYQGGSCTAGGSWGALSTRAPIITELTGRGVGNLAGIQYLPAFRQYVYIADVEQVTGTAAVDWDIYTSSSVCGPYAKVGTQHWPSNRFYYPTIVAESWSPDGGLHAVVAASDDGSITGATDPHTGRYTLWLIPVQFN